MCNGSISTDKRNYNFVLRSIRKSIFRIFQGQFKQDICSDLEVIHIPSQYETIQVPETPLTVYTSMCVFCLDLHLMAMNIYSKIFRSGNHEVK